MSRAEELATQLDAALHGLQAVRRVVAEGGREAFDASEDRNRALAFCWVSTGSALKHYEQMTGVPQGRHRCRRRSGSVIALPISVSTSWTSTSSGRPASGMLHYFCGS